MSPAKKFNPTSCTPASSTAVANRYDLAPVGHRPVERPPELNCVESGRRRGRGALQER
jgi:hypothetical protein